MNNDKPICPECTEETEQDELNMFGGICEDCREDWDNPGGDLDIDPDMGAR